MSKSKSFRVSRFFGSLLILVAAVSGFVRSSDLGSEKISVPGAHELFGPAPSPDSKGVLVFAVKDVDEPSVGDVTWIDFSTRRVKFLKNLQGMASSSQVVWRSDGTKVYFSAGSGLYQFSPQTGHLVRVYIGDVWGVALAQDDSRIAFWSHDPKGFTLVVLSEDSFQTVQKWRSPHLFGGEMTGFDVTFTADGKNVLSRTYDSQGSTPLKEFSIGNTESKTIADDCYGISRVGTYFISVSGGNRRMLMRFEDGDKHSELILDDLDFDSFLNSGNRNWIILYNSVSHTTGFFDVRLNKIVDRVPACSWATILDDGRRIYGKNGSLGFAAQTCQAN